ncbi:hypothetical protein B0H11DRAFT_1911824 [Mycena galericulata]|nr:hypothetical protein B0H11DRAFT_1911824 [Mycena galericulata]
MSHVNVPQPQDESSAPVPIRISTGALPWNSGQVKGAVPVQQHCSSGRETGSNGRAAGSGAGREATARRRLLHRQWGESHTVSVRVEEAARPGRAFWWRVLVAGKRERKAEYSVANTRKHTPNPTDGAVYLMGAQRI